MEGRPKLTREWKFRTPATHLSLSSSRSRSISGPHEPWRLHHPSFTARVPRKLVFAQTGVSCSSTLSETRWSDFPAIVEEFEPNALGRLVTPQSSAEFSPDFSQTLDRSLVEYFAGTSQAAKPPPKPPVIPEVTADQLFRPLPHRPDKRKYSLDKRGLRPVRSESPHPRSPWTLQDRRRDVPEVLQKFEKPKQVTALPKLEQRGRVLVSEYIVSNLGSRIRKRPINIFERMRLKKG